MREISTWWGIPCVLLMAGLILAPRPDEGNLPPPYVSEAMADTTPTARSALVPVRMHAPYRAVEPDGEGARGENPLRDFWKSNSTVDYRGQRSVGGYDGLRASPYQTFSYGAMRELPSRKAAGYGTEPGGSVEAGWGWLNRQIGSTHDVSASESERFGGVFRNDDVTQTDGEWDRLRTRDNIFGESLFDNGR